MHAHQQRCVGINGVRIVLEMCSIGCADFNEAAARACHDVRYTKGAPDLNEFSPRDGHLFAERQGIQCEQDRSGVVVDDRCRFGAREFTN